MRANARVYLRLGYVESAVVRRVRAELVGRSLLSTLCDNYLGILSTIIHLSRVSSGYLSNSARAVVGGDRPGLILKNDCCNYLRAALSL